MLRSRICPGLLAGIAIGLAVSSARVASAQGTLSLDVLTPGDAGYEAIPDLYCVDLYIDTVPSDVWTAAGIRGIAVNGATLVYQPDDPNTPAWPELVNPGQDHRFTTFFSRPSGRNSAGRFTFNGVAVHGAYQPEGPPVATPSEVNAAWFGSPPEDYFVTDGYIARVALYAEGFSLSGMNATPLDLVPPEATLLFLSTPYQPQASPGTVFATWDIPTLQGFDWAIWYVPEPASALVLVAACALLRRRVSAGR